MKFTHKALIASATLALLGTGPVFAAGDSVQKSGEQAGQSAGTQQIQQSQQQQQYSQQEVQEVQRALQAQGHYQEGEVDGIMGKNTRDAVRNFQQEQGIQATGDLNEQTLSALGIEDAMSGQQRQPASTDQSQQGQSQQQQDQQRQPSSIGQQPSEQGQQQQQERQPASMDQEQQQQREGETMDQEQQSE